MKMSCQIMMGWICAEIVGFFQGMMCTAVLTSEEVFLALKDIDNSKSPGVDDYDAVFLKHTWDIIGPDVDWLSWFVKVSKGRSDMAPARRRLLLAVVYELWEERDKRAGRGRGRGRGGFPTDSSRGYGGIRNPGRGILPDDNDYSRVRGNGFHQRGPQ
ncbi:hypothetical protein AKJ16_DCAP15034 [Drosera capensis]